MQVDPFTVLQYRLGIPEYKGLLMADILRDGVEPIGAPEGCNLIAYQVSEVPPDAFQKYDLVLLRDYDKAAFLNIQPLVWRILKRKGYLYIGSKMIDMNPAFCGWQERRRDSMGDDLHVLYQKVWPDRYPFHVGTHQDAALFTVKKTQRRTKRAPDKIGENEVGFLVKWYLLDCTLYLKRPVKGAPYVVFDIGPAEPVGAGVIHP